MNALLEIVGDAFGYLKATRHAAATTYQPTRLHTYPTAYLHTYPTAYLHTYPTAYIYTYLTA
eukprot:402843-Pleurochrysis_carterae.AAC.1